MIIYKEFYLCRKLNFTLPYFHILIRISKMDQISLNNYKDYDSLISKTKEIKAKQEAGGVAFNITIFR